MLIAEDDPSVSGALASVLERARHAPVRVARGADVLLRHREVDLVLLDLGLADLDGLDVLQQLRAVSDIPVVVVTARGDERSTVRALRLGADDYVVKPVRMHELLARIEAVARRRGEPDRLDAVEVGDVIVDLGARRVLRAGTEVALTPTEFQLFEVLARSAGRAVARRQIVDEVWGGAYAATSRSFDVHLAQVRQKLPSLTITTVRGFGYRLEVEG